MRKIKRFSFCQKSRKEKIKSQSDKNEIPFICPQCQYVQKASFNKRINVLTFVSVIHWAIAPLSNSLSMLFHGRMCYLGLIKYLRYSFHLTHPWSFSTGNQILKVCVLINKFGIATHTYSYKRHLCAHVQSRMQNYISTHKNTHAHSLTHSTLRWYKMLLTQNTYTFFFLSR